MSFSSVAYFCQSTAVLISCAIFHEVCKHHKNMYSHPQIDGATCVVFNSCLFDQVNHRSSEKQLMIEIFTCPFIGSTWVILWGTSAWPYQGPLALNDSLWLNNCIASYAVWITKSMCIHCHSNASVPKRCESSDLIWFQIFFFFTKSHFETCNALKTHIFMHFRLLQTFSDFFSQLLSHPWCTHKIGKGLQPLLVSLIQVYKVLKHSYDILSWAVFVCFLFFFLQCMVTRSNSMAPRNSQ